MPQHARAARASEDALLRALAAGRLWALAELLARHGPHVQAQARRMGLPDPAQAVQEVFVRVARDAACARRSPLDARAWLLLHAGVTLNQLLEGSAGSRGRHELARTELVHTPCIMGDA